MKRFHLLVAVLMVLVFSPFLLYIALESGSAAGMVLSYALIALAMLLLIFSP